MVSWWMTKRRNWQPSDSGGLFWRSHILQQLADVRRAQGILTVALDALIFATRRSLHEQKLQRLVAFRTDRVFALGHLYRQGSGALSVSKSP